MSSVLLPMLLLVVFAAVLCVGLLALGALAGPARTSAVKEMPYESGMDPIHDARRRFNVRFHLVAIAFVVFDVELLFLYPWAVANRVWLAWLQPGARTSELVELAEATQAAQVSPQLVFAAVMLFVGLMAVGFAYDLRRGIFRW